jgi:hypothetical protein
MTKVCIRCGGEYPVSEFVPHKYGDGYANQCRICLNEIQRDRRKRNRNSITLQYEKTKRGFLMRLYHNMSCRINGVQKMKRHLYEGKFLLSKDVFYEWAINCAVFHALWNEWVVSGHNMKLTPSVDRINSNEGYFLSNMEWVTHSENSRRGSISPNRKTKQKEVYRVAS